MSQAADILAHMKRGRAIDPLTALERYRCFRLAARILDLRRSGHDIGRVIITVPSGKKIARYWLKKAAA